MLGEATITFVAGWQNWERTDLNTASERNAVSIIVRLDYAGQSVLLDGDGVGRDRDEPSGVCKHPEAVMANRHRSNVVSISPQMC